MSTLVATVMMATLVIGSMQRKSRYGDMSSAAPVKYIRFSLVAM
jgi:hypothetical protein